MRRTKEEAEATKIRIIKSALPLFAASGPAATNLNLVAEAAGVTKGAIYWHFKNKWDLLDAILTHFTVPVNTFGLESEIAAQADPLGDIRNMIVSLLRNVAINEVYRQVFTLQARLNNVRSIPDKNAQEVHERFKSVMELKHRYRCIALRNAIKLGQLPDDLDVQAGASVISAMIEGLVTNSMAMPDFYRLDLHAEQYADVVISGLKTGLKVSEQGTPFKS